MPHVAHTKVAFADYAISRADPLHGAFVVSQGRTRSYDMTLLPRGRVECFTYSNHIFTELSADLRELTDNGGPDWKLWNEVQEDRLEIDEEFWVFGSETPRYFVTKSGKLLCHAGGDELEHLDIFGGDGRIVCIIQDADKGKAFAFSRESYLELKAPLKPVSCQSVAADENDEAAALSSRCAKVLMDANLIQPPPTDKTKEGKTRQGTQSR